jgi:hypothetical protein
MQRFCLAVVWTYAIACVLALGQIPATAYGWFGLAPNPFAAFLAVVLGVPWSFAVPVLAGEAGVATYMALIGAGMAINVIALRYLCRRLRRDGS